MGILIIYVSNKWVFNRKLGVPFFFNLFNWPHFFRSHDFGEPLYKWMRHQIPVVYEMRSSHLT